MERVRRKRVRKRVRIMFPVETKVVVGCAAFTTYIMWIWMERENEGRTHAHSLCSDSAKRLKWENELINNLLQIELLYRRGQLSFAKQSLCSWLDAQLPRQADSHEATHFTSNDTSPSCMCCTSRVELDWKRQNCRNCCCAWQCAFIYVSSNIAHRLFAWRKISVSLQCAMCGKKGICFFLPTSVSFTERAISEWTTGG